MIRIDIQALSFALVLTVAACARDAVNPTLVAAARPSAAIVPAPEPVHSSELVAVRRSRGVNPSDELRDACEIGFDDVARAPKFAFDKSDLEPGEQRVLEEIATCVTTGPLKGRSLRLVGRADSRGDILYNLTLGEARARSVSSFLAGRGVAPSNIATTSRGSLDAKGYDEATWQLDRRVDIGLD